VFNRVISRTYVISASFLTDERAGPAGTERNVTILLIIIR